MNERTRWAVVMTLAGVVALSLAAATLPSAVSEDRIGSGGANGTGSGFLPMGEAEDPGAVDLDVPQWIPATVVAIAVILAAIYLITNPREAIAKALVTAVVIAVIFAALFLLMELLGELAGGNSGEGLFEGMAGSPNGNEATSTQPTPPLLVVVLVIGGVIFAGLAAFYGASGDEFSTPDESAQSESGDAGSAAAGVGRAAGRAADRIETADSAENEVYRAWQEMASHLEVDNPHASTPGEFADAAIDAGIAADDVAELTKLFEEVRYGERPATDEREQHALRTLRRIESVYAEQEARDGGDSVWT